MGQKVGAVTLSAKDNHVLPIGRTQVANWWRLFSYCNICILI